MDNAIPFVYVVSTSYSGSTLLSMLMNAHPQIVSIGELANSIGRIIQNGESDRYYCSCGEEIKECHFWRQVKHCCSEKDVYLDLHNFDTNLRSGFGNYADKILFCLPWILPITEVLRNEILWHSSFFKHMLTRIIDRNLIIARTVAGVANKKIFFDASKDPTLAFHYAKRLGTNFKLIHLVKDPRSVLYSCLKRNSGKDYMKYIKSWIKIHRSTLTLKQHLHSNAYLLVQYEKFCNDPSEIIGEICRFINVDPVDLLDAINVKPHHVIGNNMRRRPFNGIRIDDDWKKNLLPEQLADCTQETANISFILGYK